MRKGFRSSRGAILGTIGWGTGFTTVAIDVSLLEVRDYALAARRDDCWYRVRHSAEQKCKICPACSQGNEISGETYVPHQGSRYRGTADLITSGGGVGVGVTFCKILATSLRTSHAIPWLIHRSIRSRKLISLMLSRS
jgi:hypothetical protein